MNKLIIDFSSFTGSRTPGFVKVYQPIDHSLGHFTPSPEGERTTDPNPPHVIGKPVPFRHFHEPPGYDLRCGLCCHLREMARQRGR
jgi:hypothetical protein